MKEVRFLESAYDEYLEAVLHYDNISKSVGKAFIKAVNRTVQIVADHPRIGVIYRGKIRRILVSRFPIALFYRIEKEEILFLVFWYTARNPRDLDSKIERLT